MMERLANKTNQGNVWFVYLARCADGSLYTGIALDVAARIALHDAGRGAKFTRGRGPLRVCATRRCRSKSEALKLELAIKRLSRPSKERLTQPQRLAAFARKSAALQAGRSRPEHERAPPATHPLLPSDAQSGYGKRARWQ